MSSILEYGKHDCLPNYIGYGSTLCHPYMYMHYMVGLWRYGKETRSYWDKPICQTKHGYFNKSHKTRNILKWGRTRDQSNDCIPLSSIFTFCKRKLDLSLNMSHWHRLSVKTDNLGVQHLYPRLPNAGDRIYIKCTYQTPLSHLWLNWWSLNVPKPAGSSLTTSKHLMIWFFYRNARADEKTLWKITLAHIIPTLKPFF